MVMGSKLHNVGINITAHYAQLQSAVKHVGQAMHELRGSVQQGIDNTDKMSRKQEEAAATAQALGRGMIGAGKAIAGGIGMMIREASRWELQFANVIKTVEGTDEELAALEGELRQLARTIPVAHEELAQIAAIAGQLGVEAGSIATFTDTVAKMGVATNLTAEEAAFALARMSTVMGISMNDVDRLASTIVHLGNNFAATESEITQMSLSAVGAARVAKVSVTDLAAMGTALAAVGVKAEAGGTAISRFILEMSTAVSQGGQKLETFAEVAGVSSEQFVQAYQEDSGQAIQMFIAGLGQMVERGDDVVGTLRDLSLNEIRVRRSLLGMAGNAEVLANAMALANDEWDDNQALMTEVERRFGTTEMQIQLLSNSFRELSISMGEQWLTSLTDVVRTLNGYVGVLADASDGSKKAATAVGAIVAALLILSGGFLVLTPRIHATRLALQTLTSHGTLFTRQLGRLGLMMTSGPFMIGVTAAIAAIGYFFHKKAEAKAMAQSWEAALDAVGGSLSDLSQIEFLEGFGDDAQDLLDILDETGLSVAEFKTITDGVTEALAGTGSSIAQAQTAIDMYNDSLYVGNDASTAYRNVSEQLPGVLEAIAAAGVGVTDGIDAQEQAILDAIIANSDHIDSLADVRHAMEQAEEATGSVADVMTEAEEATEAHAEAMEELKSNLEDLIPKEWDAVHAQQAAIDTTDQIIEKSAEHAITESDRLKAVTEIIDAFNGEIEVLKELGGSTEEISEASEHYRDQLERLRDAGIITGEQFEEYTGIIDEATRAADDKIRIVGFVMDVMGELRDSLGLSEEAWEDVAEDIEDTANKTYDVIESFNDGEISAKDLGIKLGFLESDFFDLAEQMGLDEDQANELWEMLLKGDDIDVNPKIKVTATGDWTGVGTGGDAGPFHGNVGMGGLATGGQVGNRMDHNGTDNVVARLTEGEHVLTTDEVAAMGGHAAVYAFRKALRRPGGIRGGGIPQSDENAHNFDNDEFPGDSFIPGFAHGGRVFFRDNQSVKDRLEKVRARFSAVSRATSTIRGLGGKKFVTSDKDFPLGQQKDGNDAMDDLTQEVADDLAAMMQAGVELFWSNPAGRLARAEKFAKAQHGKPYIWGGAGPRGYDCSGFMGAIENVLRGQAPHRRRYTTHQFRGGANAPPGWVENLASPFQIGNTHKSVGHMAGRILNTNVEARGGGGRGVHAGPSARGANHPYFDKVFGFRPAMGMASPAGGGGGIGGAKRWSGLVQSVLRELKLPIPAHLNNVLRAINKESGGNPRAINTWDCVYTDTMILTKRGYLKHDEVQVGDETIGYNPDTARNEWTKITRVVHFQDADTVRVGNKRWSTVVTPNHRWLTEVPVRDFGDLPEACWLCEWPQGVRRRGKNKAITPTALGIHLKKIHGVPLESSRGKRREMRYTEDLSLCGKSNIIVSAPADTGDGLPISVDEAELLGWTLGDGHVEWQSSAIRIGQTKPKGIIQLQELAERLPHKASWYTSKTEGRNTVKTYRIWAEPARDLLARSGYHDHEAMVRNMSSEQRAAFLRGVFNAEGTMDGEHGVIPQVYGPKFDAIQLAVYLEGYRPSVSDRSEWNAENGNDHWAAAGVIGMCRPRVTPLFREDAGVRDVWCVTTELGTWTARDGDNIFLTGNSNAKAGTPSMGLLQCVPMDTGILTKRGVLKPREVKVGDETLGYNPETGRNEWTKVTKVVFHETGPVVRVGNKHWKVRVTPNHRWFSDTAIKETEKFSSCPECGWKSEADKNPSRGVQVHRNKIHGLDSTKTPSTRGEFVRTDEFKSAHRIRVAAPATTEGIAGLSVDECAILGWLHGDGHIRPGENTLGVYYDGTIYQSKPEHVVTIRQLLSGIEHGEYVRQRDEHYLPAHAFSLPRAYVTELMTRAGLDNSDVFTFVLRMNAEQRHAWLTAMIEAEGTTEDNFTRVAQCDGPVQEAIKLAVYLEGHRPTFNRSTRYESHHRPHGMVGMARPHVAPSMFEEPEELGEEPVWCVKTELETWTMVQDGQYILTGNTILPTFNAHAGKYRGLGPYNPRANIYAAIRYARARYGGGWSARMARPGGYDLGGELKPGAIGENRGNMPERVLSPQQTQAFDKLVEMLDANGGVAGGQTVINQYGVNGFSDIQEIRRAGDAVQRTRRVGGRR